MIDLTDDELAVLAVLAEKPGVVLPALLLPVAEALEERGLAEVTAAGEWRLTEACMAMLTRGMN